MTGIATRQHAETAMLQLGHAVAVLEAAPDEVLQQVWLLDALDRKIGVREALGRVQVRLEKVRRRLPLGMRR